MSFKLLSLMNAVGPKRVLYWTDELQKGVYFHFIMTV